MHPWIDDKITSDLDGKIEVNSQWLYIVSGISVGDLALHLDEKTSSLHVCGTCPLAR